jgi:hypothetical protein
MSPSLCLDRLNGADERINNWMPEKLFGWNMAKIEAPSTVSEALAEVLASWGLFVISQHVKSDLRVNF